MAAESFRRARTVLAGLVLAADAVVLAFVVPAVSILGRIPKHGRPDPMALGLPALLVPAQWAVLLLYLALPVLLVLSCLPGRFLGRAPTRGERALVSTSLLLGFALLVLFADWILD